MKPIVAPLIIAGTVLLGPLPALAQSGDATGASQTRSTIMDTVFSAAERRIIGEHFGKSADSMANEDTTPPDWAVRGVDNADDGEDADDDNGDNGDGSKKDKGKGNGKGAKGAKGNGKSKSMPPGLAKRDALPPGLARQYEKNGKLPPGLDKRDLPDDLAAKLPKRPDDQEVTIVEDDVVLTDKATGVILDVIKDVVTNGAGTGDATTNPDGTLKDPNAPTEENLMDTILKNIFGGRGSE